LINNQIQIQQLFVNFRAEITKQIKNLLNNIQADYHNSLITFQKRTQLAQATRKSPPINITNSSIVVSNLSEIQTVIDLINKFATAQIEIPPTF
jgi:hypothetical protein